MVAFPRFGRLAFGEPKASPDKQMTLANIGLVSDSMLESNPAYRDRLNMYMATTAAALSGDPSLTSALEKSLEVEAMTRVVRNRVQEDQAAAVDALSQLRALNQQQQKGGAPNFITNAFEKVKKKDVRPEVVDVEKNGEELRALSTDPNFDGEYTSATLTDRVVFVAVSFVLRGIALALTDWGISTQFVNDLQGAMSMYVGIYISLFSIWALLVNSGDTDVLMASLFMFLSKRDPKWIPRIVAHVLLNLLLLPVPALLLSSAKNLQSAATYRERRAISAALSNITLLMWLGTSFVALKV